MIILGNLINLKISYILEYTSLLLKKYNEYYQKYENNKYRLIGIEKTKSEQYKLRIQIIGKASIIECSPQEIISDDRILEGFSQKDVRILTYLAIDQIKKPKYKIVMQEFCNDNNVIIFKLKEIETGNFLLKTAHQILIDQKVFDNLSKEDINAISYTAGYECAHN